MYPIYVSRKSYEEKHVNLVLIGKEGKRHYVLIKYFNTFMNGHTLHRGKTNIFAIIVYKVLLRKKY